MNKEGYDQPLNITNRFLGMLGECYCREYLNQHEYAHINTEQIFKDKIIDNLLEFHFKSIRVLVTIPKEIQSEILKLSTPHDLYEPHIVYDFLACKIKSEKPSRYIDDLTVDDFIWIEAKSGQSHESADQRDARFETKIPVRLIRAKGVFQNLPKAVDIEFSKL